MDIPLSTQPQQDFKKIQLDRNVKHYADALAWVKLILAKQSPLTGVGRSDAQSLLFPMEALFEAYVAQSLTQQLPAQYILGSQEHSEHMVRRTPRRTYLPQN